MLLHTKELKQSKNLLAFSAGIDSTALFFLLLGEDIAFDIAIVNYNLREQSKKELAYAKELANKHNKNIYIHDVTLASTSNFEKSARDIRYQFFEELITLHKYDNLITAHQLNDKLEWFLMQFTKGAGLTELMGLNTYEKKDSYHLIRPLLDCSKEYLLLYLKSNNITYFVDESNTDEKYKRNYFRKNFANQLLTEYQDGISKSFTYLDNDIQSLDIKTDSLLSIKELTLFTSYRDDNKNIRIIDKSLKKRGYILSALQRSEILKQREIIIDCFAISILESYIWISPSSNYKMDKKFKEICRINKIPKKHRAYLKENNINLEDVLIGYIISL